MALLLVAPIVILVLVLAVPIGYRYLWPIELKKPGRFLRITLAMALVIVAVATFWFFGPLVEAGNPAASLRRAASNPSLASVLRNRLLVAAVVAALVEYLLCRITQTITDG